jgi:hypothetical protein
MLVRFDFLLTEYYGWNRSGALVDAMALDMLKQGCLSSYSSVKTNCLMSGRIVISIFLGPIFAAPRLRKQDHQFIDFKVFPFI